MRLIIIRSSFSFSTHFEYLLRISFVFRKYYFFLKSQLPEISQLFNFIFLKIIEMELSEIASARAL